MDTSYSTLRALRLTRITPRVTSIIGPAAGIKPVKGITAK